MEVGGLLADRLLVVLHALRLVEDPDDRDLVVLELADDLAGELVHRDADLQFYKKGACLHRRLNEATVASHATNAL